MQTTLAAQSFDPTATAFVTVLCDVSDHRAVRVLAHSYNSHRHQTSHPPLFLLSLVALTTDMRHDFEALDVHVLSIEADHDTLCFLDDRRALKQLVKQHSRTFKPFDAVVYIHPYSLVSGRLLLSSSTLLEDTVTPWMYESSTTPHTVLLLKGAFEPSPPSDSTHMLSLTYTDELLAAYDASETLQKYVLQNSGHAKVVRFAAGSLPWHFFAQPIKHWLNAPYLDHVHAWMRAEREMLRKIEGLHDAANSRLNWENEAYIDTLCENVSFSHVVTTSSRGRKCGDGITVMLSTFSHLREARLKHLIHHFIKLDIVKQVMVVWQDIRQPALDRLARLQHNAKSQNFGKDITFLAQKVCCCCF